METTCCNLCGADRCRVLHRGHDRFLGRRDQTFQMVRCQRCGLAYLNPRPTSAELLHHYPDDYAPYTPPSSGLARAISHVRDTSLLRYYRRLVPTGRDALEIGCATGQHLAMLRDRGGWRVTGVEFSPRAAALARRVHSLNVHTGDLLSAHLPAESVDLVLMKYVLEHVPDPLGELREIRRVLRPGGRAVFWVPNLDSWEYWMLGKRWHGLDMPRHLYCFAPTTIRVLLRSADLECTGLRFSTAPNDWVRGAAYWLEDLSDASEARRWLHPANPVPMLAALPLSVAGAALRAAGRMIVEAGRRDSSCTDPEGECV